MSKLIVIGSGPAGITAAIYAKRSGIDTTVIGMGAGALAKADQIENYYGFAHPISGSELYTNGIEQAKRIGVNILDNQVMALEYDGSLEVICEEEVIKADAVVLATGASRQSPKIAGIDSFEGLGVSYCAVCDGFFHQGKDVAVLGNGKYAIHEALELVNIAKTVTILTNGLEMEDEVPEGILVDKRNIKELVGTQFLSAVEFEEGNNLNISGFFVALGSAGSTDLAKRLGASIENNKIIVKDNMATNVPGLFAAGDCTPGIPQIAKGVYEGSVAGLEAGKYIKSKH